MFLALSHFARYLIHRHLSTPESRFAKRAFPDNQWIIVVIKQHTRAHDIGDIEGKCRTVYRNRLMKTDRSRETATFASDMTETR